MRLTSAAISALAISVLPAQAATRAIPVPNFDKLRVAGPYKVRVQTGGAASVKATGPADRLDKLVVETRGDMLVLSTDKSWSWRRAATGKDDAVRIDISVPSLEAAELTGSGDIDIDKVQATAFTALLTGSGNLDIARLDAVRLKAMVTGSGNMSLVGKTDRADVAVTGSGNLVASDLAVGLLTADVMGSGNIDIGATRTAKAKVMGSGDISIAGRPACTTSKTGSGTIRCGG